MADDSVSDAPTSAQTLPTRQSDDEAVTLKAGEEEPRAFTEEELIGRTLDGRYELLEILGKGGMGAVYRAKDVDSGETVAVKLILLEAMLHVHARERFTREAKAAAKVEGEHVVQIIGTGADKELRTPYIAMEMLTGADLKAVGRNVAPLDPAAVARIGVQACRGIGAAHDSGVIHRDIKPANLFLAHGDDGEVTVKVCDFGIAKQLQPAPEDDGPSLTKTDGMLGTPVFSSPEQALNPKNVDERADIWSLCVSLYKVLTGKRVWPRMETQAELLVYICTTPIRPLKRAAPWVPAGLAKAVERGIRLEREDRWSSMAELEEALLPFTHGRVALRQSDLVEADRSVAEAAALSVPEDTYPSTDDDVEDDGSIQAVGREAEAPAARRSGVLLALAALAVGGTAAFLTVGREKVPPPAATPTPTTTAVATVDPKPAPPPATASAAPAPAATVAAHVPVTPPGASVKIDGRPQVLKEGKLTLNGEPGDTIEVELSHGGRTKKVQVVLLKDGGTAPAKLEAPAITAARPVPATKPQPVVKPTPPKPKPGWGVRTEWKD